MDLLASPTPLDLLAQTRAWHVNAGFSPTRYSGLTIENAAQQPVLTCTRYSSAGRPAFCVLLDESPLFSFAAASQVSSGAGYDVRDEATGRLIGIVGRQAARSLVWDSWVVYSPDGTTLAYAHEDSAWKYFFRRFLLGPLLPMSHAVTAPDGWRIAGIRELVGMAERRHRLELGETSHLVDFRLLLALTILLAIVQGRAER